MLDTIRRSAVALAGGLSMLAGASPAASNPQEHGVHATPPGTSGVEARFPAGRSSLEVPFRLEANKILLDVSVGGSPPLVFVLDTGAPVTLVLKPSKLEGVALDYYGQVHVVGAGGETGGRQARLARGASLRVGDLRLEGVGLVVLPEPDSAAHGGMSWDGVIGGPLFSQAVVEIDWQRRLLRLHEPGRYQAPAGAATLPLENRGGHVFVGCEVTMGGESRPLRLVVDTGASHALSLVRGELTLPSRRLKDATVGRGLGGVIRGDVGRVDELRCGGATLRDVVTSFPDASEGRLAVGADGNLGVEVLRRFGVTIDYGAGRMLLVPNAAARAPFTFTTSGMQLRPWIDADGSVGIDDVYAGSPAENAGVRAGDRVLALDAQPVASLGIDAVRSLLSQAPGTRVKLRVSRGDSARELELELSEVL